MTTVKDIHGNQHKAAPCLSCLSEEGLRVIKCKEHLYAVTCYSCGLIGPVGSQKDAINEWNTSAARSVCSKPPECLDFAETIAEICETLGELSGEEVAAIYNDIRNDSVEYIEDSVFEVTRSK